MKYYSRAGDKIYLIISYAILTLIFFCALVPLLFVLSASLSSVEAIGSGKVFIFPVGLNFKGYTTILETPRVITGFINSLRYTSLGVIINVSMTFLAAYPLSRKDFTTRKYFLFFITFTMIFSGGMIPLFLTVNKLRMIDTIWAMVLPNAIGVYNVIICKTYIESNIPMELHESARLDGCSEFYFLLKIIIPLSTPIFAVLVLFYAVGHWNSFFNAMLYLRDPALQPLQVILRDFLIIDQTILQTDDMMSQLEKLYMRDLLRYSLIIVASLPVLMLYPFIQKYFIKGIMIGSIKG
ncbi:MAG: carbohydrate ABC transporter permease [Treponema sp.]|nr:carbohydrate ABC transporter permease [Treponema sp.]